MEFWIFLATVFGLAALVMVVEGRKRLRDLESAFQRRTMIAERKIEDLHRRLRLYEGVQNPQDRKENTAARESEERLTAEKQRQFESIQREILTQRQERTRRDTNAVVFPPSASQSRETKPLSNMVGKEELLALFQSIPAQNVPTQGSPAASDDTGNPNATTEIEFSENTATVTPSQSQRHAAEVSERLPFLAEVIEPVSNPPEQTCGMAAAPARTGAAARRATTAAKNSVAYADSTKSEKHDGKNRTGERLCDRFREETPSNMPGETASLAYLELLLGRKVMGWVAAAAMILAAVIVIKLTAERITIPEWIRVSAIGTVGLTLIGLGYRYHRLGWHRFSLMLTSTGIVISFLAGYAAYGYFDLLSRFPAMILMSGIVVGCFLLAYFYRSVLLGIHAILGGLLVPLLIGSSGENLPEFFSYLFLMNLGTVLLLNTLHRVPLGLLAMLGTQLEFFLWFYAAKDFHSVAAFLRGFFGQGPFGEELHPTQIVIALAFQGAFYLLYLLDTSIGVFSKRFRTTWDDTVRAVIAPVIAFAWLYVLLYDAPGLSGYMGVYAFIGALWYALIRRMYIAFTPNRTTAAV